MTDRRAHFDRIDDLMDRVALGDITDGEFLRLWCDIGYDWYDGQTYLRLLKEADDDKCEPERN